MSTRRRVFRHFGMEYAFDPGSMNPPPLPQQPRVSSIALDVSGACNLRCGYCAECATMPGRVKMPPDVLDAAIDALFRWSGSGRGVSVHLGSGEPLLCADSVREIGVNARKRARGEGRRLDLHLTTNGTLLSDANMEWLVGDGWNVKVSLDGPEIVHDRYRVDRHGGGTFRYIEGAVRKLASKIPDRFSTTSVLCHGTDPKGVFYGIADMGVRRIEMVPVATVSKDFTLRRKDLISYRRFIFDYARRVARGEGMATHMKLQKRLARALGFGMSRVPCGAGRNFLAVGPDGALYPCFRFVGLDKYRLGDLGGIDAGRVQWFIEWIGRSYGQRSECAECWAAPLCGGPCFACAELIYGGAPSPDFCEMVRAESEGALWLISALRRKPERLVELLGARMEG